MSQTNVAADLTTPQAADAFVQGLSDAAKRAVMASLLRAGVRADDTPPADWRTRKIVPPVLTAEEIADDLRAMKERPDDTFDPLELEEELRGTGRG
jgi:hypothetical protein